MSPLWIGDPCVETIATAEQRALHRHRTGPHGEAVGVLDPAAQLGHTGAIDRRQLQHSPLDHAGGSRHGHLVTKVAAAQRMARTREMSSISTRSPKSLRSLRSLVNATLFAVGPCSDGGCPAFVNEPTVWVERRRTAGDHPLSAAGGPAPKSTMRLSTGRGRAARWFPPGARAPRCRGSGNTAFCPHRPRRRRSRRRRRRMVSAASIGTGACCGTRLHASFAPPSAVGVSRPATQSSRPPSEKSTTARVDTWRAARHSARG